MRTSGGWVVAYRISTYLGKWQETDPLCGPEGAPAGLFFFCGSLSFQFPLNLVSAEPGLT